MRRKIHTLSVTTNESAEVVTVCQAIAQADGRREADVRHLSLAITKNVDLSVVRLGVAGTKSLSKKASDESQEDGKEGVLHTGRMSVEGRADGRKRRPRWQVLLVYISFPHFSLR